MIKLKKINNQEWIYDLDEAYLMTPEHLNLLTKGKIRTINISYKDSNEILEEVTNENEYLNL